MSLSVLATVAFLASIALAAVGGVRRVRRRSWLLLAVRILRRHRWARRQCLRLARRHVRRRFRVLSPSP